VISDKKKEVISLFDFEVRPRVPADRERGVPIEASVSVPLKGISEFRTAESLLVTKNASRTRFGMHKRTCGAAGVWTAASFWKLHASAPF